jgi:hypothetical protein
MRCMADEVMAACARPRTMFVPMGGIGVTAAAGHARALILRAKRYIVDDDVAAAAAKLSVQHPDVLEQAFVTARAPVPVMWLEWSDAALVAGTGSQAPTDGTDGIRIGAIIEQVAPPRQLYRTTLLLRDNLGQADGQVIHKFLLLPFGFLHDLDQPLMASDRTDEDFMAKGIGMSLPPPFPPFCWDPPMSAWFQALSSVTPNSIAPIRWDITSINSKLLPMVGSSYHMPPKRSSASMMRSWRTVSKRANGCFDTPLIRLPGSAITP